MRGLQCSRRPMKFSAYSIDAGIILSRVPVRMESECAPVTSGVLGLVRSEGGLYLAGVSWGQIPTSLHALVVLDCTLRRVFYVLPVAKQPLVKRPSTKLTEV